LDVRTELSRETHFSFEVLGELQILEGERDIVARGDVARARWSTDRWWIFGRQRHAMTTEALWIVV